MVDRKKEGVGGAEKPFGGLNYRYNTAPILFVIGIILDYCWTGIIDLACVRCEGTPGKIRGEGNREGRTSSNFGSDIRSPGSLTPSLPPYS